MGQFRVKVRNLDTGLTDRVSVWAEDRKEANHKALKIARKLLETKHIEIV